MRFHIGYRVGLDLTLLDLGFLSAEPGDLGGDIQDPPVRFST